MIQLKPTFFPSIIITLSLVIFCSQPGHTEQLEVRYNEETGLEEGYEKWNSHIDNQLYLQKLRLQNGNSYQPQPTVIIVNRKTQRRQQEHREKGCLYLGCESWGVQYQTENYSFSYQEGYRPNRYTPIYIRRAKPTPQQNSEIPRK